MTSTTQSSSCNSTVHKIDAGKSIQDLARKIQADGVRNILKEYKAILKDDQKFPATASKENPTRNRWADILCWDHSRVKLDPPQTYIHANYVDGLTVPGKFILTQGPLPETMSDFWRMIWQEGSVVIVALTKVGGKKSDCYWPHAMHTASKFADMKVQNANIQIFDGYTMTTLRIGQINSVKPKRTIAHYHYYDWPDKGVPEKWSDVTALLEHINKTWTELSLQEHCKNLQHKPAIVVHCSAGVGRSGALVALDINIERLNYAMAQKTTPVVELFQTVKKMRAQRDRAVQRPEQYLFVYFAVIKYAVNKKLVDATDVQDAFKKEFKAMDNSTYTKENSAYTNNSTLAA